MTNKTCPSSGNQSQKYITTPCEAHVKQAVRKARSQVISTKTKNIRCFAAMLSIYQLSRSSNVKMLLGLTVKTVRVWAGPSPNSSPSCSVEKVLTMKLRMNRKGRKTPRAPHRKERRRTRLLWVTSALHVHRETGFKYHVHCTVWYNISSILIRYDAVL